MNKEFIKRELWSRDSIQKLQRDLVEQSVGSFQREYIGSSVSEETETIESIKKQNLNNTYIAMVRMLTSSGIIKQAGERDYVIKEDK